MLMKLTACLMIRVLMILIQIWVRIPFLAFAKLIMNLLRVRGTRSMNVEQGRSQDV